MFRLKEKQETQAPKILENSQTKECEALQKAELRRQMYERIAGGNALSEAEDKAFRQWKQQ